MMCVKQGLIVANELAVIPVPSSIMEVIPSLATDSFGNKLTKENKT
jgi:hypothetical protein